MSVLSEAVMQSVVKNYVENNRPKAQAEHAWYAGLPTLESVVRAAATNDGKASKSSRRNTAESLKQAEDVLVGQLERIQSYKTFDALLEGVERAVLPIAGLNDVYAYDTARRIGAYLKIMPKHVYLFTSTRTGAKQLGIVSKKRLLLCTSLPSAFQELEPYEAEDVLSNLKKLITEPAATARYFTQSRE